MMLVKSYLGLSEIQGLGVFAGEFIPAGTQIWGLNPKFDVFINADELAGLPAHMREFIARYAYPHLKMPGVLILDSDHGKFMNHSDRPNTDFTVFEAGYALWDLPEGTELTCNYAEFDPYFTGFGQPNGHSASADAPAARELMKTAG